MFMQLHNYYYGSEYKFEMVNFFLKSEISSIPTKPFEDGVVAVLLLLCESRWEDTF